MDGNGIKRKISELKNLVEKIHVLLPLARRPLIIEFSGTPKARETVAAETQKEISETENLKKQAKELIEQAKQEVENLIIGKSK